MKKTILALTALCLSAMAVHAQKYFTKEGTITFFSSTPIEDIKAENSKVTAVLDAASGKVEFAALMKSFEFEKALMEEHFNENYVESGKYPKATFKGEIQDWSKIKSDLSKAKEVTVKGTMTLHGVSKEIEVKGTLQLVNGEYVINAKFVMKPDDYEIKIPNAVKDNIAKEIEVTVDATLKELKKK